jgi:hypothetical protein
MKLRVIADVHNIDTKEITFKKDEIVTVINWVKDPIRENRSFKKGIWFVVSENLEISTHEEWFTHLEMRDILDIAIELKRIKEQHERK